MDLAATARRSRGNCYNAGQTCVAPDYVLVPKSLKAPLLQAIKGCITDFFGEDPQQSRMSPATSSDYPSRSAASGSASRGNGNASPPFQR